MTVARHVGRQNGCYGGVSYRPDAGLVTGGIYQTSTKTEVPEAKPGSFEGGFVPKPGYYGSRSVRELASRIAHQRHQREGLNVSIWLW
jgi:hypothetical protein